MLLRKFKPLGTERFRAFIALLKTDKTLPAPFELLEDNTLTEVVAPHTESADAVFANRLAAAEYLDHLLTPAGLADAVSDVGLWSWLALRFFDQLRPLGEGVSIKKLGVEESRFVPSDVLPDQNLRSKRYHRHLLRNPLQIYRLVGGDAQRAICFLAQPVHQPGDFIEQFASRQLYTRNKEMLATLSDLVVDPATNTMRRNASTKARRLDEVLAQFDCTWDLGFIAKDLLLPMLPDEFEQFRSKRTA